MVTDSTPGRGVPDASTAADGTAVRYPCRSWAGAAYLPAPGWTYGASATYCDSLLTMHCARPRLTISFAPALAVSMPVRPTVTPIASRARATTASTRAIPRCAARRSVDRMDQRVHGCDHRDRDEADHRPDHDDQRRLHHRDHLLQSVVDLFGVVVGRLFQVGVEASGLLAHLDHLYDQAWKQASALQRHGKPLTAEHVVAYRGQPLAEDGVPDRAVCSVQHLRDRDAGLGEGAQSPEVAFYDGETDDYAENGSAQEQ